MGKLLLGIDIGTTATKAAIFDLKGALQGIGQAEYPLYHIRPGWVEQNPDEWWQATCQAIRQACASIPDGGTRIAGIAVSCQAPTLLALDRAGKPLRPALIWMDRRAEAEAIELSEALGADRIHQISKNRPDAYFVSAKLLWFRKHEPDLLDRTHQFVQPNGYINLKLTGNYSLDTVHTGLMQLFDYDTVQWSPTLCEACGVDPVQFPPLMPGHQILGQVTAQAASETGLRIGTPVMVGTVDGSAAALEVGACEPGLAAEMTGTSTVLMIPNEGGFSEPSLVAMPHVIPNLHLLLGLTVASGASLRWYRDQFGAVEMQEAERSNRDVFDLLTAQAAQVKPGSEGIIFLPYMMGERSPLWHTNARGVLFGLSLASPKAAVIRAILEGTAFSLRHNVEVAAKAGAQLTEVRSVGGGSRSALWNQIKADILGFPVLVPEASIGAPFGDAVLAGYGVGLYADMRQTLREIVRIKARYEPNMGNHARYSQIYGVYRDLYEHLRGDFDRAAAIAQS